MNTSDLSSQLFAMLLVAKQEEDLAAKKRIELEQQLIELFKFQKAEGSVTEKQDGYKVTFTAKINRTVDEAKWLEIRDQLPANCQGIIEAKTTLKVVDKGMRWLEENNPELYAIAAQAITSKPAKIAVKVEGV